MSILLHGGVVGLFFADCGSRSPAFDKFKAETLRLEIMDLRKARNISKGAFSFFYLVEIKRSH